MKYIVSACLVGINCKYDGKNNYNKEIEKLVYDGQAIPLCPEVMGGLSTPRVPSEIIVIDGEERVISKEGIDVTSEFLLGAKKTLEVAQILNINTAILQKRSPSCGVYEIYDGSHTNKIIKGEGITTKLLKKHNINVITEDELWEKEKL